MKLTRAMCMEMNELARLIAEGCGTAAAQPTTAGGTGNGAAEPTERQANELTDKNETI